MSECAFCGHPNAEHRVVDAITGRMTAGEPRVEVLEDYGWTEDRLLKAILDCLGDEE